MNREPIDSELRDLLDLEALAAMFGSLFPADQGKYEKLLESINRRLKK